MLFSNGFHFFSDAESEKGNQVNSQSIMQNLKLTSRVHTGPGKPGKSWNFILAFSRTGNNWKKATGPEKFWK